MQINTWFDWILLRNQLYDIGKFTLNNVEHSFWIDFQPKYEWIEVKGKDGKKYNVSKIIPFVINGINLRFNPIELVEKIGERYEYRQLEQRIYVTIVEGDKNGISNASEISK